MHTHVDTVSRLAVFTLSFLLWNTASAQEPFQGGAHHSWPVSLETTTVTGTVIIDASFPHPMYYLDEDGDTVADYHLAFGPWWYEPANGAPRPDAGDTVTVVGAVQDFTTPATLLVFELDGQRWREPVEYGRHGWNGAPFWTEQGDTLTVTGTVLLDTTYFYRHYYLDTNEDARPDYQLGFGPAWYEPASGATRPDDGETVTVWGIVVGMGSLDHLSVYAINGLAWRPFDEPAPWAGGWIRRNHADTSFAYCVNDSTNWIGFPPGHMGSGMGGMRWPDSTFVQFWQIHPDSLPGPGGSETFMGFYLNVHDPSGASMMNAPFGGRRGMMRFDREHQYHLHYDEDDVQARGLSEEAIQVAFWDEDMQQWSDVQGATIDTQANTVTFVSAALSRHYALSSSNVATSTEKPASEDRPTRFTLHQNYPNPFNPSTTITYELPARQHTRLVVYDLLGREIVTLVDAVQPAGRHTVTFDGRGLPSGLYVYRLESDHRVAVRQLTLLK